VVPAAFAADATRVPELWLIPADGKPRALGLLRADSAVTIVIPAALRPHASANATLAVSLEPPGGSPTGAPTGPVVATGKLTNL
jgi:anti-sigma-K factor RskA